MSSSSDNNEESCGSDVEEIRQRGNRAYKKMKYKKAIRFYSAGIGIDKTIPAMWSNRAMTYAAQELWGKCEDDAREVLKLDTKHEKGRYHLMRCLVKRKNFGEAIALGQAADNNKDMNELLEEALVAQAQLNVIGESMAGPITRDFDDLRQAGMQAYEAGRCEEAIKCFQQAIGVGTNLNRKDGKEHLMECYNMLARSLMIVRQPLEAGVVFTMLLSLQEKFLGAEENTKIGTTLNNIGICAKQLGRFDDALKALKKAFAVMTKGDDRVEKPEASNIVQNIGQCEMALGNMTEALAAYQRALDIDMSHYHAEHGTVALDYLGLARAVARTDRTKAAELYRRALSIWDSRAWDELLRESPQCPTPDKLKQVRNQAQKEMEALTTKIEEIPS
eukprot:GEMP01064146.1.p1 GENE.GEMP01064146.1~~GEMP01064146.1.p1  ORF type:complete len:390 (+),score=108.89 GEMP01064146.1:153-1322(+)